MKKRWLKDWPWKTVVAINAGLCKEKNALHKPTTDGYKPAQKLWEDARLRELTLRPALPQTFALLLLQRKYFRRDRPDHHPRHQTAAGQSAQFSQRSGSLHRRNDWR
jgi:hypothetical protein